ncbi:hypothetical protein BGX34_004238 [Mortierella sp. NVP85]|nr:hypothetical protein BGX34_004238 [Mortierella sp. NVP85]
METLGKKTSTPMNFAAAAGKAPATPPASSASQGSSGTSKNGSNSTGNQSPASGSQSPAPASARTVTDKTSTAGSATSDGLDWIIGMNVKVVTQADEVYEGQVYAYDTVMNCLALHITLVCPSVKSATASSASGAYYSPSLGNNSSSRPKYDFRILKINYIKEVTPLPSGTTDTDTKSKSTTTSNDKDSKDNSNSSSVYATAVPTVGYVHLEKIQQREQQVVREAQVAAARIGVGVSTIGQDIFDALSKTYVDWIGSALRLEMLVICSWRH